MTSAIVASQQTGLYDLLAETLLYPRRDWRLRAEDCRRNLTVCEPEAAVLLGRFLDAAAALSDTEVEELFTSTFDLNPVCSLETGWHLFGEDYARGRFLVRMRGEMRRLGVVESTELPDHLTHVLPVLGRIEPERAPHFAKTFVLPVLGKMLGALENKGNAYEFVLRAITTVIEARYGKLEAAGECETPSNDECQGAAHSLNSEAEHA